MTVTIDVAPGGPPAPTVAQIDPPDGTTIAVPTDITSTLTPPGGQTITSWAVSVRRPRDPTITELGRGSGPSLLATLDPTRLPNGTYVLAITATSSGGGTTVRETHVVVDGDFKPGRYQTIFGDLSVDAGPIKVALRRVYDSTDKAVGDFGIGWRLELASFRIDSNGPLGRGGWSAQQCGAFPFLQTCYSTSQPHFVTVTWPDGHVETFDMTPTPGSPLLPTLTTSAFTARPGTSSTLVAVDDALMLSGDTFLGGGLLATGGIYDPMRFVLTDKRGTKYLVDRRDGLLQISDRLGNTVTFEHDGIVDSTGPTIHFTRDEQDRITAIDDPAGGTLTYAYNPAGDLTSATDQDGHPSRYEYDANHDLTSVSGTTPALRLDYNDGRLRTLTDATGHQVSFSDDIAGRRETTIGPNPGRTAVATFNTNGDQTEVQAIGSGHTVIRRFTYDDHHRLLTDAEPQGTLTHVYDDAGNEIKRTGPDGLVEEATYDAFGNHLEERIDGRLVASAIYDESNQPTMISYPDGTAEHFDHDSRGLLTGMTDRSGRQTTHTYDEHGATATRTTAAGTTHYLNDADGRVLHEITPTGATAITTYTGVGNTHTYTDANGHTWTYDYNERGDIARYTDPLAHAKTYSYYPDGQLERLENRDGQTLTYRYGPDGQVTERTGSDGTHVTYHYDALGRPLTLTNADSTVTYSWDDGSRPMTKTVEDAGMATPITLRFGWTPANQLATLTDPDGTTSYVYGRARLLMSAADTEAGAFAYQYDTDDRLSSLVRPNGVADDFAWHGRDLREQLTTLGSTMLNRTGYDYDQNGRLSTVVGTAGTDVYGYDADGRLTSATNFGTRSSR